MTNDHQLINNYDYKYLPTNSHNSPSAITQLIKNRIVVGDRLMDFANNKNVITISNLDELIRTNLTNPENYKYNIHIGQGICEKTLKKLHEFILNAGLAETFQISIPKQYHKSSPCLTHKHKTKNIMISEPIQTENREYECLLMLEEYCAEMSDHVTGQHIQGMVLVEAARQMVIAVTEKFFISNENKGKINFVTHSMDTKFHHFIFPLPVTIRYQILDMRKGYGYNHSSNALISFIQNDVIATEIIFKFSVYNSEFIAEKESFLAEKCIQDNLNRESNVSLLNNCINI